MPIKLLKTAILSLLVAGLAAGQTTKGTSAAKESQPKWKAIGEPVPFNQDIELKATRKAASEGRSHPKPKGSP